jgi:hypothetical protein
MKGVTVGSNISFPGAAGAYSQANYSISLLGSVSSGITEGKGKAVINAVGYRFWPELANRRRIPQSFYDSIRAKVISQSRPAVPRQKSSPLPQPSGPMRKQIPAREPLPVHETISAREPLPAYQSRPVQTKPVEKISAPAPTVANTADRRVIYGVRVSQELMELAGF